MILVIKFCWVNKCGGWLQIRWPGMGSQASLSSCQSCSFLFGYGLLLRAVKGFGRFFIHSLIHKRCCSKIYCSPSLCRPISLKFLRMIPLQKTPQWWSLLRSRPTILLLRIRLFFVISSYDNRSLIACLGANLRDCSVFELLVLKFIWIISWQRYDLSIIFIITILVE